MSRRGSSPFPGRQPEDFFDKVERHQGKLIKGFLALWVLWVLLCLAGVVFVVWVIVQILQHFGIV